MPPARAGLYGATAVVWVMTGMWALGRPTAPWILVALLVAYAALVLCGVLLPRWRVFADTVVAGPKGAQGVALTFDDGPHPEWTPRVLEILSRHAARATFFVIGRKAEAFPEVVRAIVEGGHEVGVHSYAHDRLFSLRRESKVRADLSRAIDALQRIAGKRPRLFRPPIGHTNPIIARVARQLDLVIVGWTAGGRDGARNTRAERVVARVRRQLRSGAIVLLHDSPEHGSYKPSCIEALPAVLEAIQLAGLPVVALSAWTGVEAAGAGGSRT